MTRADWCFVAIGIFAGMFLALWAVVVVEEADR